MSKDFKLIPAGSIYKTTEYDQFKLVSNNRQVDAKHVVELMNEIRRRNLLEYFPLLISSKHEVLDGQHRLEAAKRLGQPVFFIIANSMTKEDISRINSSQKDWTVIDYIEFYVGENNSHYVNLLEFINRHGLPASTGVGLLCGTRGRNEALKDLKAGKWQVHNLDEIESFMIKLKDFTKYLSKWNSRNFIEAFLKLSSHSQYSHEQMMRKASEMPRKFMPCTTIDEYMEMLLEIYNYRMQSPIRFK